METVMDPVPDSKTRPMNASRSPQGRPVLVLGGSMEGYRMAELLVAADVAHLTSFAGVTRARRDPAGPMRVGGFGGVDGLAEFLATQDIRAVIDATHPFAATMTAHAAAACAQTRTPLVHILRAPWTPQPGDRWREVVDFAEAANALAPGARALLTIGRSEVGAFAHRADIAFVARCIDPPEPPSPPCLTLIRDKGPFTLDAERALLDAHAITVLVTKNSGGASAEPKLTAARERGIETVLVRRPAPPVGPIVETPERALAWLVERQG